MTKIEYEPVVAENTATRIDRDGTLIIADGVVEIAPYAFSNCPDIYAVTGLILCMM